ncbi:hypothetical protein [Nocardia terpenica]|uniref:Diacylglycerol O-acyltransferase n=1 Tax=Nocardia terpenica TaxID=455432 RepID=A0A291RNR0_9NOCA|nr:hypothetical protein [Nocardia terpenica]ATL69241.1 hypothetical protein CRH09_26775 [Nocardia terpenica]
MVSPMNRLTADDDLFLKMHRIYGSVLVNQLAWRFDQPLDRAAVAVFHDHLAHGFGARRVVESRIPFTRPWWAPAISATAPVWQDEPVPETKVLSWLTAQADVSFDVADGRLWQLSGAPIEGGGTLLSLVASHIVADGGAAIFAVQDALSRLHRRLPVSREDSSGRLVGDTPASGVWRANLADAGRQIRAIGTGIWKAYRTRHITEPARLPRPVEPRRALPDRYQPAGIVVTVPLAQWNSVAAERMGTANGLMLGTAVGILGRCGRAHDGAGVRVDIPWSLRGRDDPRANATTAVPINVPYHEGELADLARIRAATKAAIRAYRDPANTPPLQHLQPLQMVIPDFVARRFVRTAKAPICLCSNLGEITQTVAVVAGMRARSVLLRPVIRSGDPEFFRATEIGLSMSWSSDGDLVTLAITGADPDRFPTPEVLREYVEAEFGAWGLTPSFW